jgi:hypothetical protein
MADNTTLPPTGTGTADIKVSTRKVTYSGDATVDMQAVGVAVFAGSDDAKTVTDVALTAAGAFPVTVIGKGTNASSQVTISNTSTTIIAAREGRRGVLILNHQTVGVSIDASGGTAVYATHFVLDPGASLFLPVTNAVTGITSAAYTASGDAKLHLCEIY